METDGGLEGCSHKHLQSGAIRYKCNRRLWDTRKHTVYTTMVLYSSIWPFQINCRIKSYLQFSGIYFRYLLYHSHLCWLVYYCVLVHCLTPFFFSDLILILLSSLSVSYWPLLCLSITAVAYVAITPAPDSNDLTAAICPAAASTKWVIGGTPFSPLDSLSCHCVTLQAFSTVREKVCVEEREGMWLPPWNFTRQGFWKTSVSNIISGYVFGVKMHRSGSQYDMRWRAASLLDLSYLSYERHHQFSPQCLTDKYSLWGGEDHWKHTRM